MERSELVDFLKNNKKDDKKVIYENRCEFCKKTFKHEKTLINHLCEQKRRWLERDKKYIKLAYYSYCKFFSMNKKPEPDFEKFTRSQQYKAFVKFGKFLCNNELIYPEEFIEFVIKNGVKLDEWTQDYVYEMYARELCKKETPDVAIQRTIKLMKQWAIHYNDDWKEFFNKISTTKAILWIKTGKLSPWALYTIDSGQNLLDRMSDEQLSNIEQYIDPVIWNKKLKDHRDDVDEIKKIFKKAGL